MALLYTDAITYCDRQVDAGLMSRLKEHFDDDTIIEITTLIAFPKSIEQVQRSTGRAGTRVLPTAW
ncbi:MAG: hypothetical protein ACHBNF_14035 [Chromatiales bacterium]